jgi:DNA-binding response OmpR family regulator
MHSLRSVGVPKKKILLVDDDPRFSGLFREALSGEDVDVTVAPTGADGHIERGLRSFDLIILDGQLPDTNGLEWLTTARNASDQTPVMFISASWRDSESHQKLISELGVCSIVHKPVSLEVLVDETLRNVRSDAKPVSSLESSLSQMKVGYLAEIAGEFQRILNFIRYAPQDDVTAYDLDGLVNAAHKVHGTGAIYGLEELGRTAGQLEAELKTIAQTQKISNAVKASVTTILQRAAEEIERNQVVSTRQANEVASQQTYYDRVAGPNAKRVTVVDDDTFFLKRLEHLLAAEGILLNSYSDSTHVLTSIEQFKPDLVVLDLNMPGLNGFELCRQLREKHSKQDLPIVIISADSSEETQAAALKNGANRFDAKPIKNMQFVSTIKELLAEKI